MKHEPPMRFVSERIESDPVGYPLDDVMTKIRAEDERLRRMLPAAPEGKMWRGNIETLEDVSSRGFVARVVYRLVDIGRVES